MMGHAAGFAHAVIDHVDMGETVDGMRGMAAGQHGRWRGEANRGERRQRDRDLEAEARGK